MWNLKLIRPQWIKEEPLLFFLIFSNLISANITKVGHLACEDGWLSAVKLGINSL